MLLKSGYPFYLIRHGLVHDYPKLEKDIRTDVLVMGGGISGALTAYHLIQNGIPCVVADARSIGLGSTCASTSLLQYELDVPLSSLVTKIGRENAVRSYLLCRDSIYKLLAVAKHIGFREMAKVKSLYYAAAKKDSSTLEKECLERKKAGFAVRFFTSEELKKYIDITAPAAILSKEAAQTNSYLFTHALHQYGIRKGLQVYDRTEIVSIDHGKNGVNMRTSNGYRIRAKKLVYATGYEVVNYIDKPIVKLTSTYAVASETISGKRPFWKDDMLIWNTGDPYLYMRTTPDNRIIVGGRDEDYYSPKKRDALINAKQNKLTADFKKVFPAIEFVPEFSWTGTFGSTKDGLPYIGKYPGLTNGYFALGFGGNGITFSLIAAELIADEIKGRKNKDMAIFAFNR